MYTNYYTFLLIPAGMMVCLLIKFGSDSNMSRKSIVINCEIYPDKSKRKIGISELLSAIYAELGKNNTCFMIRDLPIRFCEIELGRRGSNVRGANFISEMNIVKNYIELNSLAKVCGDMLCMDELDDYGNVFAARFVYDILIREGSFGISNRRNIDHLLNKNRVTTVDVLSREKLSDGMPGKPLTIVSFGEAKRKKINVAELIFSSGNSLLLGFSASGLMRVVDC